MELARRRSCRQKCGHFLWRNKEHVYNRATVPAPYCHNYVLFGFRVLFCLIGHALFWLGIGTEPETFFSFFTCWGLTFTMITFTILVICHAIEMYEDQRSSSDFTLKINPYSPSLSYGDNDMLRLQCKHKKLWKWGVFTFEMTLPMEICITLIFWIMLYPTQDLSKKTTLQLWRMYLDHTVPLGILAIDFALNAILFSHIHGFLFFIIMIAYAIVNMAVTLIRGTPVYSVLTWKDWRTAWEIPGMLIAGLGLYYLCYLLSQWRHKLIQKGVQKQRVSMKQQEYKRPNYNSDSLLSESGDEDATGKSTNRKVAIS